jgi:hypothetical protein
MFEYNVAPFDVSETSKPFDKASVIFPFFSSTTGVPENTNTRNFARLRESKAWRTYRAADECDELPPSHRLYPDASG